MKILTWNVRGLGSPSKRALIKNFISSYCPDFVILTEIKLQNVSKRTIKSIWSLISINWLFLKANGRSGDIILMWDDLRHSVTNYIEKEYSISTNVIMFDGFSWLITNVYGLAKRKDRNKFLTEISNLDNTCSPNWLLGGDFNVIR